LERPEHFTDEMTDGDFRSLKHDHHFKAIDNGTLMIDYMHYELPYGIIGRVADRVYLNKYLVRLLETRNDALRKVAESEGWKQYLM
jgi:ligand-binding SRPBCC domain-containing protein